MGIRLSGFFRCKCGKVHVYAHAKTCPNCGADFMNFFATGRWEK